MNSKTKGFFLVFICFLSCKSEKENTTAHSLGKSALVEVTQLLENNASSDIKIIDFRKEEAYLESHIPNAIQLWRNDIEDTSFPYKGMMASKQHIEVLFSKLGIKSEDTIVIYDNRGSCDAARLWWVLKSYGFDKVKLLNGGIHAWKSANAELSKTIPSFEKSVFTFAKMNDRKYYIDRQKLNSLLQDSISYFVLDARTTNEFSGKRQKAGAAKAGRIPKSNLLDWSRSVYFEETQKFKPITELETLYGELQIPKNAEIVTYCHTGVRSAHTTFVLTELLGYKNVKNYDGSWTEWSHFDHLPYDKDSITVIIK